MSRPAILSGRHALITGASSGIGEATAYALGRAGMCLTLLSERRADLERVTNALLAEGICVHALVADLSVPAQVAGLIERVEASAGPLDLLVNNAGVGMSCPLLETSMEDVRFLFEVNVFALTDLCRQALAAMAPRQRGHIINVTSAAAQFGSPTISIYSSTKGAVHAFTQALRVEACACGVRVSEVAPISVRTAFFENVRRGRYRPEGIALTPEAVAACILRCVRRPRAEALPFRPLRALMIANSIAPGLFAGVLGRQYSRRVRGGGAGKS